jgi:hypothetical protein
VQSPVESYGGLFVFPFTSQPYIFHFIFRLFSVLSVFCDKNMEIIKIETYLIKEKKYIYVIVLKLIFIILKQKKYKKLCLLYLYGFFLFIYHKTVPQY